MDRSDICWSVAFDQIRQAKRPTFADFHSKKIVLWRMLRMSEQKRAFARTNFDFDRTVIAKDVLPSHCGC